MIILKFFKRRTKSRYADDKAIADFTRVAKNQGLPLDYEQGERLEKLMDDPGNLEDIAKLLGQHEP